MKIIVFNGSPRAEKSNTHIMVEEFSKGARQAGADIENIFLAKKNIHNCIGCFSCWIKTPGVCVFKDDMAEFLEKCLNSDIVVFACPVYVGSVTGIMKNFIDRMLPLADPHFEKNKTGTYKHVSRYKKEFKTVLISNCGFPEQTHFKYFRNVFEYMADNSEMEIIAEIYRGGGEILNVKNPFLNVIIGQYKKLLQKAGKEVVENLTLSEETKKELEKPIIPYDKYIEEANKSWDKKLLNNIT